MYLYTSRLPYLTVVGFTDMSDGLGHQSVEIINTLKDIVRVGYRATSPSLYQDVPLAVQKIMKKKYKRLGKVVLYEDIIHPFSHTFFQKRFDLSHPKQLRLAYSMFESSRIPPRWVHNLNLYFDAVIVPDKHLVAAYQNSGVTLPIFVLPLGLNLQPFLQLPLKETAHQPFVFANFGTCIERKNHLGLIQAFYEAFGNDPHVTLWINCKYAKDQLFETLQNKVAELGSNNITLTNHCYTKAEYIDNFHKIDCYVSLSESEGFSIQPREAMALGIPCIVSDNTAQSTICQSLLVETVASNFETPAYYEQFHDVFGVRYQVDTAAAKNALRTMYDDYSKYLSQGEQMRRWALQYDYPQLRALYLTLIKPKKVTLGSENLLQEGELVTSSPALYKKYQSL